jgi:HD-GYP domain-containing protein (c-di-GMP phosphodiesterase class II)
LHQRGLVNTESAIAKVRELGITELYIDAERGLDAPDAPTRGEIDRETQSRLTALVSTPRPAAPRRRTSLEPEMQHAVRIHREAKSLVDGALADAKLGQSIELAPIRSLAGELVDSVFRNHDALACLTRIRNKDQYLLEHSVSISVLMSIFARTEGTPLTRMHEFVVGAMLHDIGKILIPEAVLHKPGRLDEAEFAQMRLHAQHSRELLRATLGMSELAIEVAAQHHEKLDGSGYPDGLRGTEIGKPGRMVAICDVYDALTADRCYKRALPPTTAMRHLLEWSDRHLDRQLVHHFIRSMGVYPVGSLVQLSNERFAVVIEQHDQHHLLPRVLVMYHEKYAHYLPPKPLDLAQAGNQVTILGAIDPREYHIDVRPFLEQL